MFRIGLTHKKRKIIGFAAYATAMITVLLLDPDKRHAGLLLVLAAATGASLLLEAKEPRATAAAAWKALTTSFCVVALTLPVELLAGGDLFRLMGQGTAAFFWSCLLLEALAGGGFAVTGSLKWAVRLLTLLIAAYSLVNYFVLAFRGTPFLPGDFTAAGTALDVLPGYEFKVTWPLAEALLAFAGIWLIAGTLTFRQRQKPYLIARAVTVVASGLFLGLFLRGESIREKGLTPLAWDQSVTAAANGSLLNFAANIPSLFLSPPEGYSDDMVAEIAARYPSDSVADVGVRPDIILVMGESWADLTAGGIAEAEEPVLPFLSSFRDREDGVYRDLLVSTYGGGTSRSEYQVFTGTAVQYGMNDDPFRYNVHEDMPGLVSSLRQLGYETTAMHTGTPDAWSRDAVFPKLGFDRFLSRGDMERPDSRTTRQYLSDEAMYQTALDILETADKPQFLYAVTIQTHGGYTDPGYDAPVAIDGHPGEFPKTEQYLGLMRDSDRDFQAFLETLERRERPAVVLAYGDHLPLVDESYTALLEQANRGDDAWRYRTFYVIWANFTLPRETMEAPPCTSLNYLGAVLLQGAGLPLTGYQKLLLEGMEDYPASSIVGYVDSRGTLLSLDEARETTVFAEQAVMQYTLMKDPKKYPDNFYELEAQS